VGTSTIAPAPSPSSRAAVRTLKCVCAVANTRARPVPAPGSQPEDSRASSSACRFEAVPPLVKTPSAPGPNPIRPAVQSTSRRSTRVAEVLWSQVSTDVFTAEARASAASAGTATGQFRCARYAGWWNQTAWSR
jgi:hypothetical protein